MTARASTSPLLQTMRSRALNRKLHRTIVLNCITRGIESLTIYSEAEPQFKLDIRNEPIQEEEDKAKSALSNVANTLRAVGLPNFHLSSNRSWEYSKHNKWPRLASLQ